MAATGTTGTAPGAVQAPPMGVEPSPAAKGLDLPAAHRQGANAHNFGEEPLKTTERAEPVTATSLDVTTRAAAEAG